MAVEESHYCLGPPGEFREILKKPPSPSEEAEEANVITLRLHLQLYYKNLGSNALILPISEFPRLILNLTPPDAGHRSAPAVNFRIRPEAGDLTNAPTSMFNGLFHVIAPGEEWASTEYVYFPVYDPGPRSRVDRRGRRLYVQLELDHSWLPVKGQEARILDWAHGVGYLWTGKVRTSPIEIEIPASPPIANCSLEFRLDRLE
jgi:hypothetical protein